MAAFSRKTGPVLRSCLWVRGPQSVIGQECILSSYLWHELLLYVPCCVHGLFPCMLPLPRAPEAALLKSPVTRHSAELASG